MAIQRTRKRGGVESPFFDWLEKYYLMLLGIIFFLPTVMKWIKDINVEGQKDDIANDIEVNNAQNIVANPDIINDKVYQYLAVELKIAKVERDKLVADTKALVNHLGVNYSDNGSWYDFLNPRGWTENDDEIEAILKRQVHNFGKLQKLYFMAFTQSRNLSKDILQFLDKDNLTRVRAFWAQYNKSYL